MTLKEELENVGIPNITETNNGTKYAYESEGKFDTEFIANCIEYGEEFYCSFYAPITYTREQLKDIGQEIAMGYGGECINIDRVVKKNTDGSMTVIEVR